MCTFAPSFASPATVALPSPALAPVTITTLPSIRGSGSHVAPAHEVADVAVADQRAVERGVQDARHHGAMDADVIVVGGGLAGLVATAELAEAGRRVILVDQEPEASLGGQAFWSLGGLFIVDSPEQRRLRIKDSLELAWQDWLGTAGFDRPEDAWPRRWARGLRRLRGGREARVAGRDGRQVRAERRLGRARRLRRDRARQLRPALPRHVGHRAGRGRAVRAPACRAAGVDTARSATGSTR